MPEARLAKARASLPADYVYQPPGHEMATTIYDVELFDTRIIQRLSRVGLTTRLQVRNAADWQLLGLPGFGKRSLRKVRAVWGRG